MKRTLLIVLTLFLAACAAEDTCYRMDCPYGCEDGACVLPPEATACPTARHDACTMQYDPVCGSDGNTYGNRCTACANTEVAWHVPGECASCAAVLCMYGSTCEIVDGQPTCVPMEEQYVACGEVRPEGCTKEYRPVCATVDTGVRCVTEPCDLATEQRTYGNACAACSDAAVYGHVPGECSAAQTCDASAPCPDSQECWSVDGQPPQCYDEQPSCETICGSSECAISESYPPQLRCSAEKYWLCEDECVQLDACPEGYDTYASQLGPACVRHFGVEELDALPVCTKASDCADEESCALVSSTTDGAVIKWPEDRAYRCVPRAYANFKVHDGLTFKDESGRVSTVIA